MSLFEHMLDRCVKGIPLVGEKFFRVARSDHTVGGTGLGLALAHDIIEAHDGRVAVTSGGLDQGSTFSIYLPRRDA